MMVPLALMVVACGKTSSAGPGDDGGAADAPAEGGSTSGAGGAAAGGAAGTSTGGSNSAGTGGAAGEAASTDGAAGSSGAAGRGGSASTGAGGAGGSAARSGPSAGCGKALPQLVTLGSWSNLADEKARAGMPPPVSIKGPDGTTVARGFDVWVPQTYDKNTPARVIYEAAAASDTAELGGTSGYAYNTVDSASGQPTILVGLDYSLYTGAQAAVPSYDDLNPLSNDFAFFPFLHTFIENNFCVDLGRELFSGYRGGATLANQMTCAFPDVLRGVVEASGLEPPQQPTCVRGHPTAGLFLHDLDDVVDPLATILPACSRLLAQNGCSTTSCNPSDTSTSAAFATGPIPNAADPPSSLRCVQFDGCPAGAPVVLCISEVPARSDPYAPRWVTQLFWNFLSEL
jgi:hypothetical protein